MTIIDYIGQYKETRMEPPTTITNYTAHYDENYNSSVSQKCAFGSMENQVPSSLFLSGDMNLSDTAAITARMRKMTLQEDTA